MMENVGKIRIGVDVDSDSADKSLDGLYKKIRDLNSSINKLLSGRITLKVGVDKQSLESTTSEINSYIKSFNNSVVKINLKLDAGAEKNISNEIGNALSNAFSNTGSNEGVFAQSMTGFKDAIQSEQAILSFVQAITDLQTVLDNVRFNDNAAEFFKKLTSSLAQTSTWGIAANTINNTWASILTFFDNLNNLDIDVSKTEQIRDTFKNLKGVYNVGETANLSSLANNLSGVQSTISGLNTEELLAKSKDIRAFVTNTSTVQNIPDTTALGTLASNLIAFNNKISSISVTSDEQKKVISYVVSIVNKLASINISTSTFDLSTVGNQLITFANSLNTINISDTATKTISTFSSVLNKIAKMSEVLSGITFNSANINTFITGITDLVQKLESVNISDKAEKIIKLADAIKTLNNASKDKSGSNLSKSSSLIDKLGKVSNTTLGVVKKLGTAFSTLGHKTKDVGASANKVAQTIKKSYTELLSKIRLITGAIKTFINTFNNLSSAYNTQVSAETRFTVAATNSANATKEQINNIKDLTAEYQQLGILGDEVQLTGLQELSTYVESTESIKKLLPVMNDMTAQQFGFEATTENAFTVATALGKVLNGNTDTLKRYGYAFDDAQKQILKYGTEEQKVAVLTQVVEASVGGMNEAMANTPTGTIKQLKNNFGDLKESLGELLTYAVLPLAKYINILILRIQSGVQALTQFIKTAFGIKTVAKDVNRITDGVSSVNNKNIDKTSDSLDDLGNSASKTKKKVNNLLGSFDELNILSDNSSDSTDNLADALNSIDSDSLDLGYGVSDTIEVPDINDFKKKIEELLASVDYSALGKEWGESFNKIIDKWNPVTSAEKLATALNNIISTVNNFLTTADFNKLGKKIGTWVNKFVHKFDSKALGNIISNGINGAIAFANGALTETNFKALGESIGDFIMGIFGNLDYEGLGDALINALDAAVSTAAGIISKIDFKAIGKGLAKATNKITQRTDTFKKLGKALSDAIIGVFDLAIAYLDETDFVQVGAAIGAFLAGLDWGTILYKAGEAIWKGLKAALFTTIGIIKENPVAGTLIGIVEALLLFKGASKVVGIVKNLGSTLGIFGKTVSTDIAQKNTSGVITKLFNSVKAFATAHPYITLILALAAAVTAVAVGVKKAMDENERYLKNRETFLKDFDVLDEKQKDLIENTETLSEDTDELKKSISNAGGAASTSAKKYKTLYDKLSLVVDENGHVKDGCDDYVDLILGELNGAFGTNYQNIDGQIQGYDKLSSSIENYISKLKASAILEGTTDKYSQAIENYTSATTDFFESVTGAEGYEDAIKHLEDSINSVLNKYSDKGLTYSVTADATTTSAVMNELMRISELSDEASLDYMRIWSNLATISKKYNIDWDDNVKSYKKLVSFFDAGGGDLEKFSGILIENNDAFAEVLRNVAVGLDNSKNKMYENADAAQALMEDNNNIIKNYEDLESVLYDVNSTTEDIDKAFAIYTNNIKTYGNASNDSLTKQSDKINAYAEKAEELYKEHKISKPIYDEIVYTQGIVNEQTKIMGEQFAKNIQESGIDAVAIKLREFAESNDISPEALFNAYVSSHTGLTQEQIIKLARILFPDSSVTELTSLITRAYTNSVISAYNNYIGTSSSLTAEDKRNFVKKLIPDVSEEAQDRIYTVLNGAISSGISRFGIGQGKKTSNGLFNKMVLNEDNKLINDKANEIGMYLSEGIAAGITKGQKYISDAQDNSSSSSLKYWNKLYGIESPSKKTKEIGEYLSEGLAVGIKSGLNKVLDAVKYVCNKTVDAYKITGMNANILKTYAYSYVSNFFNGIALKGSELVNIKNITDKVVSSFKLTLWNSGMLTKYGNAYVADYIKGVVLTEAHKKNISNIQNIVIVLLKPSVNTLNNAKIYGESIVQSMISGMTVSSANKTTISNAGTTVYNSMINSMNNLSGSLSTSSNNFIHNLTNPITNGLSALLSAMDSFYTKFRNKWQGVANLLSNKFIGNSMGITKVPNLNDNYYPFGNNIVKLAQGAVIKPNNEFMAILGDQKRGVNIETPLATMKQAFMEALNDGGYSGGNITIPVYIGNEKIDTLIVNSNNRRGMRNNGRV